MGQTATGISFTTMVLTLWTLSLGAYTWYWLRQPIRTVHIPQSAPQDVALRTGAGGQDPEDEEGPPLEGLMLLTLQRVNGRLARAERRANNGKQLKYFQLRTWLLSCICHFADSSTTERARMKEVIEETSEMSDDDESPWKEGSEDEKHLALNTKATAFKQILGLLQFDSLENVVSLVRMVGEAMRQRPPAEPTESESVEAETNEDRARRYASCGISEASDPDFWQELHFGPRPASPAEDDGLMEF